MEQIKNFYDSLKKNRFKVIREYKLDRWIFQAFMFGIFGFLFLLAFLNNFELDYFNCPEQADGSIEGPKIMLKDFYQTSENINENGECRNPFYKDSWKSKEWLTPGEYGKKPSFIMLNLVYICMGLLALSFVINHFIYNRGYFSKIEETTNNSEK